MSLKGFSVVSCKRCGKILKDLSLGDALLGKQISHDCKPLK